MAKKAKKTRNCKLDPKRVNKDGSKACAPTAAQDKWRTKFSDVARECRVNEPHRYGDCMAKGLAPIGRDLTVKKRKAAKPRKSR